jgi:AraC family transcriptional regulator, transcriptional activator of pobA
MESLALRDIAAPVVAGRSIGDDRPTRRAHVTHGHATLAFYTDGGSRIEQNGEWTLAAGDVLVVPAGQPHRMLERRRPSYWGLGFCVPCFAAGGEALLEPFERVRDGASAVVHIPSARQPFLEALFGELAEGPRTEAVQLSLLTLIVDEVDRAARVEIPSIARSSVVADSLRFIERNCLRPLTLREVAAAVRRSPAYVTTALSKATGRTAVEWIVSGRMAQARRLLLHSDERVDVIAERVGYADATHFIRMFRREHGATPAAWRLRARAGDDVHSSFHPDRTVALVRDESCGQ